MLQLKRGRRWEGRWIKFKLDPSLVFFMLPQPRPVINTNNRAVIRVSPGNLACDWQILFHYDFIRPAAAGERSRKPSLLSRLRAQAKGADVGGCLWHRLRNAEKIMPYLLCP